MASSFVSVIVVKPLDGRTHNQKQPTAMKYQFHLTCRACPEQYDVKDGNDHPIDPKTGDYTDGYHE